MNQVPPESRVLLAGAIVTAALLGEAFRRLMASRAAVHAKQAIAAPVHISGGEALVTMAVVKDAFDAIGKRMLRPPAAGARNPVSEKT